MPIIDNIIDNNLMYTLSTDCQSFRRFVDVNLRNHK